MEDLGFKFSLDDQLSGALGKVTLLAFLTKAINKSAQFEKAMADAQSVMMTGLENFNKVQSKILSLGGKTTISMKNIATALYDLASAGLDSGEAMTVLEGTMNLAEATGMNLSNTAQLLTKTVRAFNMEFSETNVVAEMFATTARNSQVRLEDISSAMVYANQIGATFKNQTLEGILSSMGILANNGMKANTSMRMLRSIMTDISKPTKKLNDFLKSTGLTLNDVSAENNTLVEILSKFNKVGATSVDIMELFGKRSQGTFKILSENVGNLMVFEESVRSQRLLNEQMNIQWDTLTATMSKFATMVESKLVVGLDDTTGAIKQLLDSFIDLGDIFSPDGNILKGLQIITTLVAGGAIASGAGVLGAVTKSLLKIDKISAAIFNASTVHLGVIGATIAGFLTLSRAYDENFEKIEKERVATEKTAAAMGDILEALKKAKEIGDIPAISQILELHEAEKRKRLSAALNSTAEEIKKTKNEIARLNKIIYGVGATNQIRGMIFDTAAEELRKDALEMFILPQLNALYKEQKENIDGIIKKKKELDKESQDAIDLEIKLLKMINTSYSETSWGKTEAIKEEIDLYKQAQELLDKQFKTRRLSLADYGAKSDAIAESVKKLNEKLEKMASTTKKAFDIEGAKEFANEIENKLNTAVSGLYDELKNVTDLFTDATFIEQIFGDITNFTAIENKLMDVGNALKESIFDPIKKMGKDGFDFVNGLFSDQRSISEKYGKPKPDIKSGMMEGFSLGGMFGSAIGGNTGSLISALASGNPIGGIVASVAGELLGDVFSDLFGGDDDPIQLIRRSPLGDPRKWNTYLETLEAQADSMSDIVDTNNDMISQLEANYDAMMENTSALNESAQQKLTDYENKDNPFWGLISELENISTEYSKLFSSDTLTQQLSDIQAQMAAFYASSNMTTLVGDIGNSQSTIDYLNETLSSLIDKYNYIPNYNYTPINRINSSSDLYEVQSLLDIFSDLGIATPYTLATGLGGSEQIYYPIDLISSVNEAIDEYVSELGLLNDQYDALQGQESTLITQKEIIEDSILGTTDALDSLREAYSAMSDVFQQTVSEEFYKDFQNVFNPMQLEIDALNDKYAVYSSYITDITNVNSWYEESLRRITEQYDEQSEAISGVSSAISEEYLPLLIEAAEAANIGAYSTMIPTIRPENVTTITPPALGTLGDLGINQQSNIVATPSGTSGAIGQQSTPNVIYMNNYISDKYDFQQVMADANNALDSLMGGI